MPANPSGNAQIKLTGIAKFTDLDVGATDEAILIPTASHPRIAIGMKQWIMKARGKTKEAIAAKQEFEFEKITMIDELTNRNDSQMISTTPNDIQLGYGN